jgi:putative protease
LPSKPELLVSVGSLEELHRVIDAGADAVNIGDNQYGVRMPGNFALPDLKEAIKAAHQKGKKAYVSVNNLMDHKLLKGLPEYLTELVHAGADAVVFGDPAVLMALKQANVQIDLHWNAEMTSTNYVTANYWAKKGAVRAVLSRELNLQEVHEIKRNVRMEVQVQVHGITNIYHSKRHLLQSYMDHCGKKVSPASFAPEQGLFLVEHERPGLRFPIYEDQNGTHIMSAEDICMLDALDELLQEPLDSLKIEGFMKSAEYNETVVRSYRQALDAYLADPANYRFNDEWLRRIEALQDPHRELTYGFFFKEQVY